MAGKPQSFTVHYPGLVKDLRTAARVCAAFDPKQPQSAPPVYCDCAAIWDTGASGSVITDRVVKTCGLKQIGMTQVIGVNSITLSPVFLVNIELPNNTGFAFVHVTLGQFKGGDLLIGMDIIRGGDFVVTNKGGRTVLSFRSPSVCEIDFKRGETSHPRRNDPCPCGSGKKYKQCCGANI